MIDCKCASACGLNSPQLSAVFISGRCLANRWPKLERKLLAVGIADHVVVKTDAAHPGALHRQRLQQAPPAVLEPLRPNHDLFPHRLPADIDEPPVVPVAMRKEHARLLAGFVLGPIEIASDKEPWHALEIDLLNRVIALVDLASEPPRSAASAPAAARFPRHCNLPPDFLRPLGPRFLRLGHGHRKIAVQILRRLQARIVRLLPLGQHSWRRGRNNAGQCEDDA